MTFAPRSPLYGLILAGGKSQRMGEDKGLIQYGGKCQIDRCLDLLNAFSSNNALSVRYDQYPEDMFPCLPRIYDKDSFGPLSGILSAFEKIKDVAWLVLACDLPGLDRRTVQKLCEERDSDFLATVFCRDGDFLEPLCAIYEPKIREVLMSQVAIGVRCPRKIFQKIAVKKIVLINSNPLVNINTQEERSFYATEYNG